MTDMVPAASAIIIDDQHRVVLVLRGTEPEKGHWSIPGRANQDRFALLRRSSTHRLIRVVPGRASVR